MNQRIRSDPRRLAMRVVGLLLVIWSYVALADDDEFRYFVIGEPQASIAVPVRHPQTALVLMGGGQDVDQAFRWMIRRAGIKPGSGGRFVVLRASGADGYNPYIYYSGPGGKTGEPADPYWVGGAAMGLSSVETLVIPSRAAADDPFVNDVVRRADAIFIAGGDQSRYIRFWKGTALDRSLTALLDRNVPIGGTSAGLAILGEYAFAALQGTIDSAAALSNPFDPRVTLDPDPVDPGQSFLVPKPLMGVLTDSHFDRRRRMGRLVAFLSRLEGGEGNGCLGKLAAAQKNLGGIRGIGVSEQAALLIESTADKHDYIARRVKNPWSDTEGAVYFVRPLAPPSECEPGVPLSIDRVEIRKLADSRTVFNLTDWSGVDAYTVSVENGHFDIPPY
ncbi:cyanophycinase [Massilia kyonggiensis]|nr:cyanophycinase [Massilia kyonggiensis]